MKPTFEILDENTIRITTPMGQRFEVVCKNATDHIEVRADSPFGSVLSIHPRGANAIRINEERI